MTEQPYSQIDQNAPSNQAQVPTQDDALRADPLLIEYLAQRSEPCPSCRYDLRGLHGRHCPECGQPLRLRVGLEQPNLGSYIVGLVALASAAGFNLLMFLFFVAALLSFGAMADLRSYFISTMFFGVISAVLLLLWIMKGSVIRRKAKHVRITLALLAWLIPLSSLLGMLMALRYEM